MLLRLRARYRDEVGFKSEKQITLIPTLIFTSRLHSLGLEPGPVDQLLCSSALSDIGNFVATSQQNLLIATVAYWPEHHWGFLMITISGGRVQARWGDGMKKKVPRALEKGIRLWSKHYMPQRFHEIFGDPYWTKKTREQCRVDEFLSCMEFCMDINTVDALLIPPLSLLPVTGQSATTPVSPPHPVSTPISPPRPPTKRRNSNSIMLSAPVSPSRITVKRPRRGSQLNLNVIVVPNLARRDPLPEDDTSILPMDDQPDAAPLKEIKIRKSKSMVSKEQNNKLAASGLLVKSTQRWNNYVAKLRQLDAHVEVYDESPEHIRLACCSSCAKIVKQSEPYNTYRFKQHLSRCKAKGSRLHIQSINGFFKFNLDRSASVPKVDNFVERPCPGLTEANDSRIPIYTSRTEVRYAGGTSRPLLASQHFGKTVPSLSKQEKDELDLHYRSSCEWELDHDEARVFSCKCLKLVQCKSDTNELQACAECLCILKLHKFLVAIAKPVTPDDTRKYIPFRYQSIVTGKMYAKNKGLGRFVKDTIRKKGDVLLNFTVALASGVFDGNPSFIELLKVMFARHERQARGHGLQNMRYAADFNQFCHELQCIRPEAYRLFSSTFGGRTEQSMLKIRSSHPKLTLGISTATLDRVTKYLEDYKYPSTAPLACGVDDTKLHPSLRPYYNSSSKTWFLLGATGEPIVVADIEQLDELIKHASGSLAKKVRLWSLWIPLPDIPPLIMAIMAISESNTANYLAEIEKRLLKLLLIDTSPPVNIISLGSDGTIVERKARRILVQSGFAAVEYAHISHPNPAEQRPLKIELLRIGTRRLAIIQDSKHFRKTCRNNLFTGAKQMVLGRELIYYEQVRSMAYNQDRSPLYIRDVDKLDRQDDRAAARLFSAASIQHAIECGHSGLAIFLFIFGEACDAYQSRTISHTQRIHMVLLAFFFKLIWKQFLTENRYPIARHFLSQDADNILDILVNGLLALIIIHRDHLDPFPLLPWTHGTEVNEHIFGLLRSTLPEFTIVDALQMIPKLDVRLLAACRRKIDAASLQRGGAGYAHTHFDSSGAALDTLSYFPPQEVIEQVAHLAWTEANAIWEVLGDFTSSSMTPSASHVPVATANLDLGVDVDDLDELDPQEESAMDVPSDRELLDEALHIASFVTLPPSERPDLPGGAIEMINECGLAAAALNMRDIGYLDRLPDDDPEALEVIQAALKPILEAISALGPVGEAAVKKLIDEAAAPPSAHTIIEEEDSSSILSRISQYDISILVDERRVHQSKETSDACRPLKQSPTPAKGAPKPHIPAQIPFIVKQSPRQLLTRKIHEVLRLSGVNIKGETSGLARQVRWTKQVNVMSLADKETSGNSANAKRAATSRANAAIKSRQAIFAALPHAESLATANINSLFELVNGVYSIVLYEKKLMIGRGGEKASKHSWVSNTASVGTISWISMQLWTPLSSPNSFKSLTQAGLPKYRLVHSKAFLYALMAKTITLREDSSIKLDVTIFNSVFRPLNMREGLVSQAVKTLMGRKHTEELDNSEN
ncbi:Methionine--tRNA ligase, mitochondrial [Pleurotus ostreatus]|nr:Methionine--tRNA ligase, mitochondrial [Pleurotus ostreatus]